MARALASRILMIASRKVDDRECTDIEAARVSRGRVEADVAASVDATRDAAH
jgi:hypothetical protein